MVSKQQYYYLSQWLPGWFIVQQNLQWRQDWRRMQRKCFLAQISLKHNNATLYFYARSWWGKTLRPNTRHALPLHTPTEISPRKAFYIQVPNAMHCLQPLYHSPASTAAPHCLPAAWGLPQAQSSLMSGQLWPSSLAQSWNNGGGRRKEREKTPVQPKIELARFNEVRGWTHTDPEI